jgi:hypothetical protein
MAYIPEEGDEGEQERMYCNVFIPLLTPNVACYATEDADLLGNSFYYNLNYNHS